jgi:hypothetical protein
MFWVAVTFLEKFVSRLLQEAAGIDIHKMRFCLQQEYKVRILDIYIKMAHTRVAGMIYRPMMENI